MTTHIWLRGLLCLLCAKPCLAADTDWPYTIHQGDTLIDIAAAYLKPGAGWRSLQSINKIADPKRLRPGSTLRIPLHLLRRDASVAEVVHVQGEVWAVSENGHRVTLQPGSTLQAGDALNTAADSSASLRFADGSRLLVTQQSAVTMRSLLRIGKTGMSDTRLQLESGSVETQVEKQQGSGARYEIRTPALNLGVRGTAFRVRVDATTGLTRSEVQEGVVAASAQRREVLLQAGYASSAEAGAAPKAPQAVLGAPDLKAVPAVVERIPVQLNWPALPAAQAYRAQIFSAAPNLNLLLDSVFTKPQARWEDLPDGQYRLRVRAIDAQGFEGMDGQHDFVLQARPEPPFILQPQDKAVMYGDSVVMKWSRAPQARAYRLEVSSNADFAKPLLAQDLTEKTEFEMPLSPGHYFWRLASITPEGRVGPFSDALAFEQRAVPASPELAAPALDADHISFGWKAGSPGERYQFQLARDAQFQDIAHEQESPEPSVSIPRPAAGTYYLRARTIDAAGFAGKFGPTQTIELPHSRWWWMLLAPAMYLLIL